MKALQKLGLSTEQLIDVFLGARAGELSRDECIVFWDGFSSTSVSPASAERASNLLLTSLLTLLMQVLDEKKEIRFPIQSLINTINFCQFYLPIKADSTIENLLKKKWQEKKQVYARMCPSGDEVIRTLTKRLLDKDEAIDTLVVQSSTLHSLDEFNRLSDLLAYPIISEEDVRFSGELSFVYPFLHSWAGTSKTRIRTLIETSLLKMRTLPQQLKMSPKLSETGLLASQHIVRQFLGLAPIADAPFLTSSLQALEQFYVWPSPYGDAAFDLMTSLKNELQVPAWNVLNRVSREESHRCAIRSPSGPRSHPIYYIMDASCPISSGWSTLLQFITIANLAAFGSGSEESPHCASPDFVASLPSAMSSNPNAALYAESSRDATVQQKAAILVLLLSNDQLFSIEQAQEVVGRVKSQDIHSLYAKAVELVDATVAQKIEDSKSFRLSQLLALKSQIEAAASASVDWKFAPSHSVDEFSPANTPSLHVSVPQAVQYIMPSLDQIEELGVTPFPRTPYVDELLDIFEMHSASAAIAADKHCEVRIVVAGGPHVLHCVTCAYLVLKIERPDLFQFIIPRFFLLPIVPIPLSAYLARHDSWYNRHVFIPFRSELFLLPKPQTPVQAAFNFDPSTPLSCASTFFRNIAEEYACEAQHTLNVSLFKVDCWTDSPNSPQQMAKRGLGVLPDQSMPMIQRLEIGFSALPAGRQLQPPALRLQYTRADLDGHVLGTSLDDTLAFQHIVLSHVPQPQDVCFPADPSSSSVEMFAFLNEASKAKAKSRVVRSHVSHVEISSADPNQLFYIIMDGLQFGPYYRITVSPLLAADGSISSLPISTFFPIKQ